MPSFHRHIGIDYSGAETPTSSLKGLRVYSAAAQSDPREVLPPSGPKKYWTRRGIAEWLVAELNRPEPTLVGIDHAFSFPARYFERHGLPYDWGQFLDDFAEHWPTDHDHIYVDFVRDGIHGKGAARTGDSRWRRIADVRARAKSPFHFDVQGSVAKSTHAGLPWLRFLKRNLGTSVHFWPFDGWEPAQGKSVIAEVYPALWSRRFPQEDRTADQHDAYAIAASLAQADRDGDLERWFRPNLSDLERKIAQFEGWILGSE